MDRYNRETDYDRRRYGRDDDRGFFDRAGDEVRSWFGDDGADGVNPVWWTIFQLSPNPRLHAQTPPGLPA